jgi:hypothetical protein
MRTETPTRVCKEGQPCPAACVGGWTTGFAWYNAERLYQAFDDRRAA